MSNGVFTRMKRVEFVEKLIGEVGDGTAWPMEVTLDQLAEILYRVKDAWFTSGSITTTGVGLSMEGGSPPAQLITGDGVTDFFIRGYCWWGQEFDLRANDAVYFGSPYGPDILPPSDPFSVGYLSDFFPPTVEPWVPSGLSLYRDTGDSERIIWLPEYADIDPLAEETAKINGETLRTAFSQEMSCFGAGAGYLIDHPAPTQLRLEIYPEVAWVDTNASGNPYDPLNRRFLKMRFGVLGTASPFDNVPLDTMPDSGFHSFVDATDLIFQLSTSQTSAKIYFYEEYDGASAADFVSGSPFIVTAQEWWPYAKAGGAVWNTSTGAKI